MAKKILIGVSICGALLLIGTVGRMDCNIEMSGPEEIIRYIIGFGMVFAGILGHDFLCETERIRRDKKIMSKLRREEIKNMLKGE